MSNCMDYFITGYRRASNKQKSFINGLLRDNLNYTLQDNIDINKISVEEASLIIDTLLGKNRYTSYEKKYLARNY